MAFELIYLYHSGFALCFDSCSLLFDYFEDSEGAERGFTHEELLHRPGPLYVLASHFHADHFTPQVFKLCEPKADVRYIFSRDIYKHRRRLLPESGITFLRKGESYCDDLIEVKAFGSTDVGVSFYVRCAGKEIFHAGDLNNWHWREESSAEEAAGYERAFAHELKDITAEVSHLDLAMFPADPRLGQDYLLGPQQFLAALSCRYFAPMHFDEAYDKAAAIEPYCRELGTELVKITQRGQRFVLN